MNAKKLLRAICTAIKVILFSTLAGFIFYKSFSFVALKLFNNEIILLVIVSIISFISFVKVFYELDDE